MITKLPFMNHNNTKYWLMESEFTSTFKDFVLPDAVTRFRQGQADLLEVSKIKVSSYHLMIV